MLESIGVPLDKLKFVRGTDYQLSRCVRGWGLGAGCEQMRGSVYLVRNTV